MTPKTFAGLLLVAAVSLLTAGVVSTTQGRMSTPRTTGDAAISRLADRANEVAAVEVRQGDKLLTLERKADAWSLKERDGYAVKPEKVRQLVVQLAQARLVERKTQSPDRHSVLELEDPSAKEARSRAVRLLDNAGKPLGEIVLGKKRLEAFGAGKHGIYIRKPGDKQTWLASADVDAPVEVRDWVDRQVLELDTARLKKVAVTHTAGETLVFERKGDKDTAFELKDLKEGQKLKQGVSLDALPRAFGSLELEDLRKAVSVKGDPAGTANVETVDGLTLTFTLRKDKDDHWLAISAAGADKASDEAQKLQKRLEGWEFKVPSWKADSMFKKRADLLEAS